MASRRAVIAGPSANLMPSSMSATITPVDISTDKPSASSVDQKSDEGIPRYMHVTRPTFGSRSGGIVLRRKSGATRTSLSLITKYDRSVTAIIFCSENTFAFGQVGGPDKITRLLTWRNLAHTRAATASDAFSASREPKIIS